MPRIIVVLAMLMAVAVSSRVSAADLAAMSRSQKRIYCVAYGLIDVRMRYLGGEVDKARFDWERKQLTWKIMNRGDNFNYAPDFRKLDAAIDAIVAEAPSPAALSAQAAACRRYLRL